jgi:hypothetical protein
MRQPTMHNPDQSVVKAPIIFREGQWTHAASRFHLSVIPGREQR